jgi:hypothetical protein
MKYSVAAPCTGRRTAATDFEHQAGRIKSKLFEVVLKELCCIGRFFRTQMTQIEKLTQISLFTLSIRHN